MSGLCQHYQRFFLLLLLFSFNLYQHLHKHEKEITILYNKLQYIVLQSCYKSTIKCESNVEYNLTS